MVLVKLIPLSPGSAMLLLVTVTNSDVPDAIVPSKKVPRKMPLSAELLTVFPEIVTVTILLFVVLL